MTASAIVKLRLLVAVCAGELESFTWTVIVNDPDCVGVPLMAPLDALKLNPVGNAPDVIDHAYGVVPPIAANCAA